MAFYRYASVHKLVCLRHHNLVASEGLRLRQNREEAQATFIINEPAVRATFLSRRMPTCSDALHLGFCTYIRPFFIPVLKSTASNSVRATTTLRLH